MADDGSAQSVWPLVKFHFSVDPGDGVTASFAEVSGLDNEEPPPIEYRSGNSAVHSAIRMPGLRTFGNVTLKRVFFRNGGGFATWLDAVRQGNVERRTVAISLLDESGAPAMTWTLANAWPTKFTGADTQSGGDEIAIETIELAHEGLTVANS